MMVGKEFPFRIPLNREQLTQRVSSVFPQAHLIDFEGEWQIDQNGHFCLGPVCTFSHLGYAYHRTIVDFPQDIHGFFICEPILRLKLPEYQFSKRKYEFLPVSLVHVSFQLFQQSNDGLYRGGALGLYVYRHVAG